MLSNVNQFMFILMAAGVILCRKQLLCQQDQVFFKSENLCANVFGVFIHPPDVGAVSRCQSLIIFMFISDRQE